MSKKKNKKNKTGFKKDTTLTKKDLMRKIIGAFRGEGNALLNYKQIAKKLDIKEDGPKLMISKLMEILAQQGRLDEVYKGKFQLISKTTIFEGLLDLTVRNTPMVWNSELNVNVYISPGNLRTAMNGDKVRVAMYSKGPDKMPEGEIEEVLDRVQTEFVGRIELSKSYAFLVIDNKKVPFDIFIPPSKIKKAQNGDKVKVRIVEWPEGSKNPIGEVLEIFGQTGTHQAEMHAIMAEYGLPIEFPPKVITDAAKIDATITEEEIAERRDFRKITTFTIDPFDAKDFDDALSLELLSNGNWEVGVHIADVTHYVDMRSALEKEAVRRATSVYLVDRVVPMLPERLSNELCSLRPNEDKLTFSAVFEMDANANILKTWLGKTIIHSDRRFTYEEALEILLGKEDPLQSSLITMDLLAQNLRAKRFREGSIAFDRQEVRFKTDQEGKPLGVVIKSSTRSTQLIEEFMLQANRSVAEYVGKPAKKSALIKSFVYRVHDEPDFQKMSDFRRFIKRWGYQIELGSHKQVAKSMNGLLSQVKGKVEQDVVAHMAVRAMAKAIYSTENGGHYGLAFANYTHFTSPIRRYPDMMVHRMLFHYLKGGKNLKVEKWEERCKHSSDMEQRAEKAERASVKYKQVEFMKDKIGQQFAGIISGLTEWGMYVEMEETRIEGMVPLRDLNDDYYAFDEDNYWIMGRKKKKKYQLGDKVIVKITKANLEKKQLDMIIIE